MANRFYICASVLLAGSLWAQEPSAPPTFDSNAKLVLVPFHVRRGTNFATNLQASDFILREDGHPRPFTIFEGPNTAHPLPLELILLFDTTPGLQMQRFPGWNPKVDYPFTDNWDESITRDVLEMNGRDIRIAVYHYNLNQLERLCAPSRDPGEIANAFHALLDPIPAGKGELTLLPGFQVQKPLFGPNTWGWLHESIVSTLKDATASPVPARRLLLVFTTGIAGTHSKSYDAFSSIVDPALTMNIPIDPVILDFYQLMMHVSGSTAPNGSLGENMSGYTGLLPWFYTVGEKTGGKPFVPPRLDLETMAGILGLARNTALSQYVVGFSPEGEAKPKKHSLSVALNSKSEGKLVGGERDGVTY